MSQMDRVHFFPVIIWVVFLLIVWYMILVVFIIPNYYKVMRSRSGMLKNFVNFLLNIIICLLGVFIIAVSVLLIYFNNELVPIIFSFIKKISWIIILKIFMIILLFLSVKLGLKKFENKLLMIKRYLLRFRIIMFIVGLFMAFMNFFFINFDHSNVGFAMNEENSKGAGPDPDLGGGDGDLNPDHPNFGDQGGPNINNGGDNVRPNVDYKLIISSGVFIFAGLLFIGYNVWNHNYNYDYHGLEMTPYTINLVNNIFNLLLIEYPGILYRSGNYQMALDIVFWAFVHDGILRELGINIWNIEPANIQRVIDEYRIRMNIVREVFFKNKL